MANRKAIEKLVIDVMNILDKTGANGKVYKDQFKKMNDTQFNKHMESFFKNDSDNFYLETETYVTEPALKDIEDAAKFLGVPLYEVVALPFSTSNPNGDTVTTSMPVPVGYIHMKRVQQTILKKNTMSIHVDKRQGKTGQVMGDDKNARVSDSECIVLLSQGLNNTLKEMLHAKADNLKAKTEMHNKISTDGFVSLKDVSSNKMDKVALNTLDVFLTSAMIKTDLITGGLVLPRTLKGNRDVSTMGSKYQK